MRVAIGLGLLLLASCAQPLADDAAPRLVPSGVCQATTRNSEAGVSGDVAQHLRVRSDGGWCSIGRQFLSELDRRPRGEPMVVATAPRHGEVDVSHMVSRTRVSYRAAPGYAGPDSFVVRGVESNLTWRVEVTAAP